METTETILPTVLVQSGRAIAAPAAAEADPEPRGVAGIFDLLLRGQKQLTRLVAREQALPGAIQGMLAISLLGMAVHGLVVGLGAQLLDPARPGWPWQEGLPALWMPVAFVLAFIGALLICLPTFYFHTQLAGLDASFRLVAAQALRAQATTSVLLLGIAPFYAAYLLAHAVGFYRDVEGAIQVGLMLPFAIGLFGIRAVYLSFQDLLEYVPISHRRRGNYLARMVLLWGAVYSAVAPVALWRLAEALSQGL